MTSPLSSDARPHAPARRSGPFRRRRSSRRPGPPRGVGSGHPWWAYVLLVLVAVAAAALVTMALLHDYTSAAAALS